MKKTNLVPASWSRPFKRFFNTASVDALIVEPDAAARELHQPDDEQHRCGNQAQGDAADEDLVRSGFHQASASSRSAMLAAARPRALGALLRYFRDLDTAEEAFQEACLRALKTSSCVIV